MSFPSQCIVRCLLCTWNSVLLISAAFCSRFFMWYPWSDKQLMANSYRFGCAAQITDTTVWHHWSWLYQGTSGVKIFFWPRFRRDGVLKSDVEVKFRRCHLRPLISQSHLKMCYPTQQSGTYFFLFSHLQPSCILVVTCSWWFLFSLSFFPASCPVLPLILSCQVSTERSRTLSPHKCQSFEQIWKIWSECFFISLVSVFLLKVYQTISGLPTSWLLFFHPKPESLLCLSRQKVVILFVWLLHALFCCWPAAGTRTSWTDGNCEPVNLSFIGPTKYISDWLPSSCCCLSHACAWKTVAVQPFCDC